MAKKDQKQAIDQLVQMVRDGRLTPVANNDQVVADLLAKLEPKPIAGDDVDGEEQPTE